MRLRPISLLAAAALLAPTLAPAATLNGTITDLNGNGVHPLHVRVYDNKTGVLQNTPGDTTNATGNYSFTVPAGKWDLVFDPAFALHMFQDTRRGVQVTASQTVSTNRTLSPCRYLTGRIVDAGGAGLLNVNLNFHDPVTGAAAAIVQGDLTDAAGNFTTQVPPGPWDVQVIPPVGSHTVPREFPGMDLSVDQALGTQAVQPGFIVSGTITDQSLFPLANASFDVRIPGPNTKVFVQPNNTSAAGTGSFVLPAGIYDVIGKPPTGGAYACRTAWSIDVNADKTLPNLALPPGVTVSAHCQDAAGAPVANVDMDADSLPLLHRLHTPNDASGALGNVTVLTPLYKFKMTFAPPVASKLLPITFDSIQVTAASNLGTLVHQAGHWVSVNVVEHLTTLPIEGANLDFVNVATGRTALTIDDVTSAAGLTKVTTDRSLYNLVVRAPAGSIWNNATLSNFRSLNDTTITVELVNPTLGVGDPRPAALELATPWPNPSRGAVSTAITSASADELELSAWDVGGRRVAIVFRSSLLGRRTVVWDTRDQSGAVVSPGLYWLRLSGRGRAVSQRVIVMR